MDNYVVIGINGKEIRIQADDFEREGAIEVVRFFAKNKYIALFETKNIIGFYKANEVADNGNTI